jgi:hypothetical protein
LQNIYIYHVIGSLNEDKALMFMCVHQEPWGFQVECAQQSGS